MKITHVPLLTDDQEREIKFWETLGLEKKDDNWMDAKKQHRWVTMGSSSQTKDQKNGVELILQHQDWGADSLSPEERKAQVGKQPGLCLASANIEADAKKIREAGGLLLGEITQQMWGKQLLFKDLLGNTHVLVQPPVQ